MRFDRRIFTKEIIEFFGQSLRRQATSEVLANIETLLFLSEMDDEWKYTSELAYFFATIGWETAWTFSPIVEKRAAGNQQDVRRMQDKYWSTGYYGRGYVQLTWKDNYKKLGNIIDVDLVAKPNELLKPSVSYEVAAIGMRNGLFRSRNNGSPIKLSDFVNENTTNFTRARDIINGDVDKHGKLISGFAEELHLVFNKSLIAEEVVQDKDDILELTPSNNTKSTVTSNTAVKPNVSDRLESNAAGTSPWTPPIKIDPTAPAPTGGPKSLVTAVSTAISSLGITGSAIWGHLTGIIPNLNPTFLFIALLVCICVISSVYIISRIYIKNARENRSALLDMQRVEITADPTKVNVECQSTNK